MYLCAKIVDRRPVRLDSAVVGLGVTQSYRLVDNHSG
ncbi:Uncharacterised protein [Vibrio cholerae]|nr:Uncharacterised protein [Vibrio cholerae]